MGSFMTDHGLRKYSTDELLTELVRRRNERRERKPAHWCDHCANFTPWCESTQGNRGPMPEGYNPCTKGHKMLFATPQDMGDEYGFYRHVCIDRVLPAEG